MAAFVTSTGHPSAWKAEQFGQPEDYALDLTAEHLIEISRFVESTHGLALADIEPEHFQCPALATLMARVYEELRDGRGMLLVRGLPVEHYSLEEVEKVFWAMGTHMGVGLSQSVMGDRLGHVIDTSREDPTARAYRNRTELNPHTDMADIVGLACIRGAKSGGVSLLSSAISVHDEMAAQYPEYLERLYEGFHFHRYGEEEPGDTPYTPYKIPVFSTANNLVSVRFIKTYIIGGQAAAGQPLTAFEVAAIDKFLEIANRPDMQLRFVMKAGEMQFLNNFTTLHARTEFNDFDEVDKRRHMLRLWIHHPEFRPLSTNINLFEGQGVRAQAGKKPSFDLKAVSTASV